MRSRYAVGDLLLRGAPRLQRKREVLGNGHVREQRILLKYHADISLVRLDLRDRPVLEEDFAGRGVFKPRQHLQASRLAASRRAEQRDEFALGNTQIEVVHGQRMPVVTLADTGKLDESVSGGLRSALHGICPKSKV